MKTLATPPAGIEQIDALAKIYSCDRQDLADRVDSLQLELQQVRNRHMRHIKAAARKAGISKGDLALAIEMRPELFVQPRTFTLHGIKLGMQKGKGRIEWDNEQKVVERLLDGKHPIEGRDPQEFVETTHTPRKDLLLELPAKTLKALGCTIAGTGDSVVIKAAGSDVEKLVAKLLEEGVQEAQESAA